MIQSTCQTNAFQNSDPSPDSTVQGEYLRPNLVEMWWSLRGEMPPLWDRENTTSNDNSTASQSCPSNPVTHYWADHSEEEKR